MAKRPTKRPVNPVNPIDHARVVVETMADLTGDIDWFTVDLDRVRAYSEGVSVVVACDAMLADSVEPKHMM